jgi:hypothetical protein
VRWEKTCTNSALETSGSALLGAAECGLMCDESLECKGFVHYVDYGGGKNKDKIGRCDQIVGNLIFGAQCDAIEDNTDIYLRADIGSTCQASCNVHQRCSAFVFNEEDGCQLFSDIALDVCAQGEEASVVHVGQGYRERDALVAAVGQCFIEFEDIAEIGCYGNFSGAASSEHSAHTPFDCQQTCKQLDLAFYAISGSDCYCNNTEFYRDLPTAAASECNLVCTGDPRQYCGGSSSVLVGSTNLPRMGLTLAQCKKECFISARCEAILFDETTSECELRSVALFEDCGSEPPPGRAFVESLEHYYEAPTIFYRGAEEIHTTSTRLRQECHVICDAFLRCEAIRFDLVSDINNCHILGGAAVPILEGETAEGVEVARDVTLFTRGLGPDSPVIKQFTHVFDFDECRTLCEEHAYSGSMQFARPNCMLYEATSFANTVLPSGTPPYYVNYRTFVDLDQDFAKAEDLCIFEFEDSATIVGGRWTGKF